jgi:hypothetical protein
MLPTLALKSPMMAIMLDLLIFPKFVVGVYRSYHFHPHFLRLVHKYQLQPRDNLNTNQKGKEI